MNPLFGGGGRAGRSSPSNKGTIGDCKDEKDPVLSGEDRY